MSAKDQAYDQSFKALIKVEGTYSNNPKDPGGETMYGIAKRYHPKWWANGRPTLAIAKIFYWVEYWQKLRISSLSNCPNVQHELFDTAVNMSKKRAVKFMQLAYNILSEHYKWTPLKVDGAIGPRTIRAINLWCKKSKPCQRALAKAMNTFQSNYYLTRKHKGPFLVGWLDKRT